MPRRRAHAPRTARSYLRRAWTPRPIFRPRWTPPPLPSPDAAGRPDARRGTPVWRVLLPVAISLGALAAVFRGTYHPGAFALVARHFRPDLFALAVAGLGLQFLAGGLRLRHVSGGVLSPRAGIRGQITWDFMSALVAAGRRRGAVRGAVRLAREPAAVRAGDGRDAVHDAHGPAVVRHRHRRACTSPRSGCPSSRPASARPASGRSRRTSAGCSSTSRSSPTRRSSGPSSSRPSPASSCG